MYDKALMNIVHSVKGDREITREVFLTLMTPVLKYSLETPKEQKLSERTIIELMIKTNLRYNLLQTHKMHGTFGE